MERWLTFHGGGRGVHGEHLPRLPARLRLARLYDPAWLDHAEAAGAHTVRFVFKRAPDVAAWQYGALQGPIVQKTYWEQRSAQAAGLLPPPASLSEIDALNTRIADLQGRVQALVAAGLTASGDEARRLQSQLQNQQGDLDQARNQLARTEAAIEAALQAARQALYALDDRAEPTLGVWAPAGLAQGAWTNAANPAHPFGAPHFDRAVYRLYPDQAAALQAFQQGQVDSVLLPGGLPQEAAAELPSAARALASPTSSVRFVVINPDRPELADPALRRTLFCSVSRAALAEALDALPLTGFTGPAPSQWSNPQAAVDCGGYDPLSGGDEPFRAAAILKAAGYTWQQEPGPGRPGSGLAQPGGIPLPPFVLLAPGAQSDPQGAAAADFVERSARYLGIPLRVQTADPAGIRFALFNDHDYDLAIAGWRLAAYPGYLCEWFGPGNPLGYHIAAVEAECSALRGTGDLQAARSRFFTIQAVLARDPPFLPLFSGRTYDLTRGLVYPFDRLLNGLSGVYGAPSLAIPAVPLH